ncbi:helix-turn-helix domain-containing protein [Mycobacterium paragordonae]|uniref:Helix-turn-helix domain-containing protein n=1 Tax=Mycobacterium paragordonae TaxID=1389713 RepID=A0A4V3AWF7_9MYCO|nr:helix-turn-helix domain-containing protein [Mycobacterium paragordonae]MDP7738989.1 helix-turn-helix domain-containing protein [Mycobacterium paragordonae]TDK90281.1 DNA-binding protein [Mycobacterium paragordonae]TDL03098.1 DNA-binding protein [Mycobacterium paragordonae]
MIQRLAGVYLDAYDVAFVVEALDHLAQLIAGPTPARLESVTAKLRRHANSLAALAVDNSGADHRRSAKPPAQPPVRTASVRALQRDSVQAGRHVMGTGQAASCLGVTPNAVRDLARRGRLEARRTGTRWQFDAAGVIALAERRAAQQGG